MWAATTAKKRNRKNHNTHICNMVWHCMGMELIERFLKFDKTNKNLCDGEEEEGE
jgi:hypothetical protein